MVDWLDRKIRPMLATSGRPFDDPAWLYEIKWDGIRTLAFFGRGRLRLQGRRLADSTERYPDVAAGLRRLAGEAVLDGEIVVLEDGRPDFERVLLREQVRDPRTAALRARQYPAVYVVFDLLYRNGDELIDRPLEERKARLGELLAAPPEPLVPTSFVLERGVAYFREAVARGLEGVVAKRLESRYVPGVRSRDWIKFKARRRIDAVVVGIVRDRTSGRVRSLVLGAYDEGGRLVWIGNVGSGLDERTLAVLDTELEPLRAAPPLGFDAQAPGAIVWLRPALVARVEFSEWTREGRLRAPALVGFVERDPASCRLPERRR